MLLITMWNFSKKRFFITLGLSILVWLISGLVQMLLNKGEFGSYVFGTSCEITGYPIARCVSSYLKLEIILNYLINVIFWFWVIHLFWGWFQKSRN